MVKPHFSHLTDSPQDPQAWPTQNYDHTVQQSLLERAGEVDLQAYLKITRLVLLLNSIEIWMVKTDIYLVCNELQ